MEGKDIIAIAGIGATLLVSTATLVYTIWNNRQTLFVNTVTTSRLKWIDSLRDKISEFMAVAARLEDPMRLPNSGEQLLLQRDTLLHQIILHLNPNDAEDNKIKALAIHLQSIQQSGASSNDFDETLIRLREATALYLKKEWNRVKTESKASSR